MIKSIVVPVTFMALLLSLSVHSEEQRPEHFEGKMPNNETEANALFTEYNARLAEIVMRQELTMLDLNTIHELTYTLENALPFLEDSFTDAAALAESLEALHIASETGPPQHARQLGQTYLQLAK